MQQSPKEVAVGAAGETEPRRLPPEILAQIAEFLLVNAPTLLNFSLASKDTYKLIAPLLVSAATLGGSWLGQNRSIAAVASLFCDSQNVGKLGYVRRLKVNAMPSIFAGGLLRVCDRIVYLKATTKDVSFLTYLPTTPCLPNLATLALAMLGGTVFPKNGQLHMPNLEKLDLLAAMTSSGSCSKRCCTEHRILSSLAKLETSYLGRLESDASGLPANQ